MFVGLYTIIRVVSTLQGFILNYLSGPSPVLSSSGFRVAVAYCKPHVWFDTADQNLWASVVEWVRFWINPLSLLRTNGR